MRTPWFFSWNDNCMSGNAETSYERTILSKKNKMMMMLSCWSKKCLANGKHLSNKVFPKCVESKWGTSQDPFVVLYVDGFWEKKICYRNKFSEKKYFRFKSISWSLFVTKTVNKCRETFCIKNFFFLFFFCLYLVNKKKI